MYCTRIRPLLEYASPISGGLLGYLGNCELERVHKSSLVISGVENKALKKLRRDAATKRQLDRTLAEELHSCLFPFREESLSYKRQRPYTKGKSAPMQ